MVIIYIYGFVVSVVLYQLCLSVLAEWSCCSLHLAVYIHVQIKNQHYQDLSQFKTTSKPNHYIQCKIVLPNLGGYWSELGLVFLHYLDSAQIISSEYLQSLRSIKLLQAYWNSGIKLSALWIFCVGNIVSWNTSLYPCNSQSTLQRH